MRGLLLTTLAAGGMGVVGLLTWGAAAWPLVPPLAALAAWPLLPRMGRCGCGARQDPHLTFCPGCAS